MEREAFRRLLRRYSNDKCTAQERRLLEDLILRNPVVGEWDWSSEEERVLMGLRIKKAVDGHHPGKSNPQNRQRWLMGIAASFLVLFGACWFVFSQITADHDTSMRISETSAFPDD